MTRITSGAAPVTEDYINTEPFTIVGVAPPIFQGSTTGLRAELWIPIVVSAVARAQRSQRRIFGVAADLNGAGRCGSVVGMRQYRPLTFVVVVAGLAAIALIAVYIPTPRAVRVDPLLALRHE